METSPKLGPLSVSAPEIWLAAQTPNYKISFPIKGTSYMLYRYRERMAGKNADFDRWAYDGLRSEANIINYQLHPWANYLTCLSLFLHF